MKAVKRFDLYRKVPRDLTEPTLSGAQSHAMPIRQIFEVLPEGIVNREYLYMFIRLSFIVIYVYILIIYKYYLLLLIIILGRGGRPPRAPQRGPRTLGGAGPGPMNNDK